MLLELRQLAQSISGAGISAPRRDDRLVSYPKGKPLFRVTLTAERRVGRVALVPRDRAGELLKYEVSTGGARESVPGFNVLPLYSFAAADALPVATAVKEFSRQTRRKGDTPAARGATLRTIRARGTASWPGNLVTKINLCLGKAVEALRDRLRGAVGDDLTAIAPLVTLLERAGRLDPAHLRAQMVEFAETAVRQGTDDPTVSDALLQLLFVKEAAVMLELDEGAPANHPAVWAAVNRVLVAEGASRQAGATAQQSRHATDPTDAFGTPHVADNSKMPTRRLPRLGDVKLRSHAKEKRCQIRYGMAEADSCPVATRTRDELADALAWLTAHERAGRTYRDISNACGFDKPALLLVYPEQMPATPPALAALFADEEGDSTDLTGQFEATAETVTRQLETASGDATTARVHVVVLVKADKARTRVLVSRQFSAARIIAAAREWRAGARNIPPVFFRRLGADRRAEWGRCASVPFPTQVSRCLNRVWFRGGEGSARVSVFDFGAELTLFLETGPLLRDTAARALGAAVAQWPPLLLGAAAAAARGETFFPSLDFQFLLPSALGLLLAKLGHRSETYMSDTPYWIGRLMSLADRVHHNYCVVARKGQLPPELLGNALMLACLENPRAGLARVVERLPLYYSVAGTELRRALAEVERHIDRTAIPQRPSDEQKAQLLLGYIARPDLLPAQAPPEPNPPTGVPQ